MVCIGLPGSVCAESLIELSDADRETLLLPALVSLEMTEADLGFFKDVAEPEWAFAWSRKALAEPLSTLTRFEVLRDQLRADPPQIAEALPLWLECDPDVPRLETTSKMASIDGNLPAFLIPFLEGVARADSLLGMAFADVDEAALRREIAGLLAGHMNAEERPGIRASVEALFPDVDLAVLEAEANDLDPAPALSRFLNTASTVDLGALLAAAQELRMATRVLCDELRMFSDWPEQVTRLDTPWGEVCLGSSCNDVYGDAALLILDPAGDDVYGGEAGVAFGPAGRGLAVIVDLEGEDRYGDNSLCGPGTGVAGVALLFDESGDDVYRFDGVGGGAGVFGVGWMEDAHGSDVYDAETFSQGAGSVGVGVCVDHQGNDVYRVGYAGQGYAGVRGLGLLVDRAGNDAYLAGGLRPDYGRHDDRFLSMAQGFGIGARPAGGGGLGVLADLHGNDSYTADIYGQGCGYWYSAGLLLDEQGHDQYTMHQYGQGAGIHLALGVLADGEGSDQYTGAVLVQGAAHDYGVGVLMEGAGDDTYSADHHAQGRGLNNALAILLDRSGVDGYFSRQCDRSQGIGDDGDTREYGSLALLLDGGGLDQYSCGGENGQAVTRPDFGVIFDRSEALMETGDE